MPSKSAAQARTMRARCHGWKPDNPKIARIPREVACEYAKADAQAKQKKK